MSQCLRVGIAVISIIERWSVPKNRLKIAREKRGRIKKDAFKEELEVDKDSEQEEVEGIPFVNHLEVGFHI